MKHQIYLTTKDNIKIATNYYRNHFDSVVIIAPGWLMTKDSYAFTKISATFARKYDVLTLDFRGHGKSQGTFTFTAKELLDIDSVINYAKSKNYKKIYLVGFSLGGAIVLIRAAQSQDIDKVIAISAPADFDKIENYMWKKEAWLETLKKFELNRFLSHRINIIPKKKIKPIDIVEDITAPTLFIAGEKDPTVYNWHTKLLYDKATCPKKYKMFQNGYHAEDLYIYFKKEFSKLCLEWLE